MLVKPSMTGSAAADRVGYLHFDLSALAGKTVSSAVLSTESVITDNTTSPSTERIDAHGSTGSFSETTLTYAGKPDLGPTIGSFVAERTKKWTQANVSASVASFAKDGKTTSPSVSPRTTPAPPPSSPRSPPRSRAPARTSTWS